MSRGMSAGRTLERVRFVPLADAGPEVQERVRELRNQESVRRHSYTDHVISAQEHARWLESLRGSDACMAMAIMIGTEVVGAVSLTHISRPHGTASWGFHLDETRRGKGLGSEALRAFLRLAFEELGLQKVSGEVLETNAAGMGLHEKLGFVREGLRREPAVKDGRRIDVHLLGLTREQWEKQ